MGEQWKGKSNIRKHLLMHIGDILAEQGLIDDKENEQLKVLIDRKYEQCGGEDDTSRYL
ncbi:MAG: hypothetical protein J6L77_02330 [Coprococcus sp.]|nr:hypothetical protein [Coprococcus sp.]